MGGMTPLRVAFALLGGGIATYALYTFSLDARLPAARAEVLAHPTHSVSVAKTTHDFTLKRVVIHQTQPGDVIFSLQGHELQVEFRAAKLPHKASASLMVRKRA